MIRIFLLVPDWAGESNKALTISSTGARGNRRSLERLVSIINEVKDKAVKIISLSAGG